MPLLVAAVVFTVLMTWQRGQVIVTRRRRTADEGALTEFLHDLQELTYFLSRITIVGSPKPSMQAWQTRLFLTIAHNAANPAEYFGLPVERPIGIGAQIPSERSIDPRSGFGTGTGSGNWGHGRREEASELQRGDWVHLRPRGPHGERV